MLFNTVQHHTFQIRVSGPKFARAASLAAQNEASGDRSYGSAMVMTCSVDVPAAIFSHFLVQQRHFSAKSQKRKNWDSRGLQVAFFLPKKGIWGSRRPSGGLLLFTNSNVVQVLLSVATVVLLLLLTITTVLRSQR